MPRRTTAAEAGLNLHLKVRITITGEGGGRVIRAGSSPQRSAERQSPQESARFERLGISFGLRDADA
jgi:hypothetical protein